MNQRRFLRPFIDGDSVAAAAGGSPSPSNIVNNSTFTTITAATTAIGEQNQQPELPNDSRELEGQELLPDDSGNRLEQQNQSQDFAFEMEQKDIKKQHELMKFSPVQQHSEELERQYKQYPSVIMNSSSLSLPLSSSSSISSPASSSSSSLLPRILPSSSSTSLSACTSSSLTQQSPATASSQATSADFETTKNSAFVLPDTDDINNPGCSTSDSVGTPKKCIDDIPGNPRAKDKIRYAAHGRIKRPMNAFMVWSQLRRAEIASTDVKMHNSQISKELGAEWRKMSAEQKAPYVKRAKELREELLRRHPDYVYRPKRKFQVLSVKNLRTAEGKQEAESGHHFSPKQRPLPGTQFPRPTQDFLTQLFLAQMAQGQPNSNIFMAAALRNYQNQLIAAAASANPLKRGDLNSATEEKLRSTMVAGIPADPFGRFLPTLSMLQSQQQFGALNPLLSSQFAPFLFGARPADPESAGLPATVPVAAQK